MVNVWTDPNEGIYVSCQARRMHANANMCNLSLTSSRAYRNPVCWVGTWLVRTHDKEERCKWRNHRFSVISDLLLYVMKRQNDICCLWKCVRMFCFSFLRRSVLMCDPSRGWPMHIHGVLRPGRWWWWHWGLMEWGGEGEACLSECVTFPDQRIFLIKVPYPFYHAYPRSD